MPPKAKKTSAVIPETMTALRDQLEKRYGTGRVVRREEVLEYDVVSTGSLTLDYATRVGGIVRGRTHEIVGPEGVGKTTLTINTMIEAQKAYPDLAVGYIDMEQTFDYDWAERLGLDTSASRWVHIYPDDSEDVSDQLRMMCRTDLFSVVAVDSIGGMESKKALNKDAEGDDMGSNAKVITRMVKNVAVLAARHNVGIIFINQLRANLSGMGSDISAGPKALKYNTTMKIDMKRASGDRADVMVEMKFDGEPDPITIGVKIKCKVTRNKVAPHGYVGEFWIFNHDTDEYGPIGIDRVDEAVSIGVRLGIIAQGGGGNYTLPDGRKVRGKPALVDLLREELDVVDGIRSLALARVSGEVVPDVVVTVEATDE
jgi:recombination protein RecA